MIRDTRFNFAGCMGSDLVSHYTLPMIMRCMFAVRPFARLRPRSAGIPPNARKTGGEGGTVLV